MDMATTTHKEQAMITTDHSNVCSIIHDPELVTISMTVKQIELLKIMCDTVRDDDDDSNPCVAFADALYTEIDAELNECSS
jgi:hypothetical protein